MREGRDWRGDHYRSSDRRNDSRLTQGQGGWPDAGINYDTWSRASMIDGEDGRLNDGRRENRWYLTSESDAAGGDTHHDVR